MEVRVPASPAPRPVAVSAKSSPVMDGAITPKTPSPQIHERLDAMALAEATQSNFLAEPIAARIAQARLRFNSPSPVTALTPSPKAPSASKRSQRASKDKKAGASRRASTEKGGEKKAAARARRRSREVSVEDLPAEWSADIQAFFEAVSEGDSDLVDELLAKGVPVDATDDESNTALLLAAEGEPLIIESLLRAGTNVNHQNAEGFTALIRAVEYEDEAIIKQLLAAGAQIDLCDNSGKTADDYATNTDVRLALGLAPLTTRSTEGQPKEGYKRGSLARDPAGRRASTVNVTKDVASLFDAVANGDVDVVKAILKAGLEVDSRDDDSNTALIIAAEGEPAIVEMLIGAGASIDLQNKNGVTALIAAVKYEDVTLVEMLIQAGAALTMRDRKGRCAADFAQETDPAVQDEMLALFNVNDAKGLQKRGKRQRRRKSMVYVDAQSRELFDAVSDGDLPRVRDMIEGGYSVNGYDDDNNTALIFAAEREPLIVDVLIQCGAKVNHQNRAGNTALMVAIKADDVHSIRLLVAANTNTNLTNNEGLTAFDLASLSGSDEIIRLVLGVSDGVAIKAKSAPALKMEVMRRGSLPSCTSTDRRTRAFLEAITEGDIERVERILQMSFDVNVRDDANCGGLHFAAEGEANLVALLLKHGADVNATNDGGETPLIKAVLFNDADSTAVLLKAGASPTIKDRSGHSAADYAEHSKSSLISSLMREASR